MLMSPTCYCYTKLATFIFDVDSQRHNDIILICVQCLFSYSIKIMGFSDDDKILIKNLHDSAWNSLWDFFNDTFNSNTACELPMLILSISVTFSVICFTVAPLITKPCWQRWPIRSCLFYKVVHLQIWGVVVDFRVLLVTVNFCLQQ